MREEQKTTAHRLINELSERQLKELAFNRLVELTKATNYIDSKITKLSLLKEKYNGLEYKDEKDESRPYTCTICGITLMQFPDVPCRHCADNYRKYWEVD